MLPRKIQCKLFDPVSIPVIAEPGEDKRKSRFLFPLFRQVDPLASRKEILKGFVPYQDLSPQLQYLREDIGAGRLAVLFVFSRYDENTVDRPVRNNAQIGAAAFFRSDAGDKSGIDCPFLKCLVDTAGNVPSVGEGLLHLHGR